MKKNLLLITLFCLGFTFCTFATHYRGSELTYKAVSPNTYEVIFKIYQDCSAPALPAAMTIQIKAPGCNTGRGITVNNVGQVLKHLTGPGLPNVCNTSVPANILIGIYSGQFTFTATEQACTDWVLSWNDCCRNSSGNLIGQANIYTEAHLKLLPNLVNSSPQFDTINFNGSFVNVGPPVLISALAQDKDGDSLVYSSVAPLAGVNMPINYVAIPNTGAGGFITNPKPQPPFDTTFNPQIAIFPAGPGSFSPGLPLFSFQVNWVVGQAVNVAQPFFQLNPHTGNIAFQPFIYYNSASAQGQNKYEIAILVEEFRRINGVMTRIGAVRRESFIEVMDGAGNTNPYLSMVEVNKTNIAEGDLIELRPGVTMNLKLSASDDDATNSVIMASNVNTVLPGAVFSHNGLGQPAGTIIWTPTASHVRDQPYYFNVVLKDDANPLRGYHERTIGVRVRNNGSVTGTKEYFTYSPEFSAYPNPFTSEVQFRFSPESKAEKILIYNLLGRLIDQVEISKAALGTNGLSWKNACKNAEGIYIAKLMAGDKNIQTLKFIKLQ